MTSQLGKALPLSVTRPETGATAYGSSLQPTTSRSAKASIEKERTFIGLPHDGNEMAKHSRGLAAAGAGRAANPRMEPAKARVRSPRGSLPRLHSTPAA